MNRKQHIVLLTLGVAAAGLACALLVLWGLKIPCLFHTLTKLHCPGCGNTRAAMALLRLELGAMLHYNLMFPVQMLYVARVYILCAARYVREGKFAYHPKADWVDITFLALLVLWTVIRNVTPLF